MIMLMRNLDISEVICNGTCLVANEWYNNGIKSKKMSEVMMNENEKQWESHWIVNENVA